VARRIKSQAVGAKIALIEKVQQNGIGRLYAVLEYLRGRRGCDYFLVTLNVVRVRV
jgi:hypothetical protein